ncbi:hypothetical protein BDZ94DRAFT_1244791 [Collybia nuda]|uniref:Uncharacterized protein n=1 Tax=Collybia nuda TaxID=64659 RepID=A0A9P5YH80_9AGAR|nr:hypothetical protein BDZ94DRAFT_1244791 [Collybia nuda]
MADSNALASKASQCLDLVRRHTRTISQPSVEPSGDLPPSVLITQYLERATQTMAQPQPSMTDVFDARAITDPMWGSELTSTYLTRFPNMELCCENVDPVPLQRFINEWSL